MTRQAAASGTVEARKKTHRRWILPVVLILLVAILAALFLLRRQSGRQDGTNGHVTATADTRTITESLEGTGPLMPADAYTVTSLREGEILGADFEEGDVVGKDTELYRIDSSDAATGIERAELTVAQNERNLDAKKREQQKLTVRADAAGSVTTLAVEVGDKVQAGQTVATIRDSDTLKLTVPFASHAAQGFRIGQTASVRLEGSDDVLTGAVREVAGADTFQQANYATRDVTVEVANPGALSPDTKATVEIGVESGLGSAAFAWRTLRNVTAEVGGEVAAIRSPAGSRVENGDAILTLSSDTIDDAVASAASSLKDAQLALQNQVDQQDAYIVTSPIRGTIVEKNYKLGDTLKAGEVLCRIYDLSWLEMSLPVDELDISKVAVNQKVTLTAAAVPGRSYEGRVTRVNINGTTSGNVTTYPVTIRIDETEGLLPGMNVDARIVVAEAVDAVSVPAEAVRRGDTVLVRRPAAAASSTDETGSGNATGGTSASAGAESLPAGFIEVPVRTGVSDGDFVQILDGLSAGETIAYQPLKVSSGGFQPGMLPGARRLGGNTAGAAGNASGTADSAAGAP